MKRGFKQREKEEKKIILISFSFIDFIDEKNEKNLKEITKRMQKIEEIIKILKKRKKINYFFSSTTFPSYLFPIFSQNQIFPLPSLPIVSFF